MKDNTHMEDTENKEEPIFRRPKNVQHFKTFKTDLQDAAKKNPRSLAQMVISSKEKKWQEQKAHNTAKILVPNKYKHLSYKLLFIFLVLSVLVLLGLRLGVFSVFFNERSDTVPATIPNDIKHASSTDQTSTSTKRTRTSSSTSSEDYLE